MKDLQTALTAEQVIEILGLRPHPEEGGWYLETYRSKEQFAFPRYSGSRSVNTAIYYMLTPETFSELHVLPGDEIFHHYAGDEVEMLQLAPGGKGEVIRIGPDLASGARPQVLAPGGVWQGSRLKAGGQWALLGCTVAPGFDFADYRRGDREELLSGWPEWRQMIEQLTHA